MAFDLSDEALIERYRKTQEASHFTSLVRRYENRLYNAAFRILDDREEAYEVVQETYIRVHLGLSKFNLQASFCSWIFRISHNICIDKLRIRQRKNKFQMLSYDTRGHFEKANYNERRMTVVTQVADTTPGPELQLEFVEQTQLIQKALNQLPDTQRTVLVLHDIEGLSYEEIAEIVGANLGTVRSRLHYGRLKLRELIAPYYTISQPTPAVR